MSGRPGASVELHCAGEIRSRSETKLTDNQVGKGHAPGSTAIGECEQGHERNNYKKKQINKYYTVEKTT